MSTASKIPNDQRDKLSKSALSCQQLAERLVRSGIISKEQMQEFWKKLTDERRSLIAFAGALVTQNLCTAYQLLIAVDQEKPLLKVGSYVIVDKIGEGGMGQVFRAVHQKMKREVALKVLANRTAGDSQAAQRFTREVEAAARLSHKNIVTAYDAGDENGMPYLVMEYVVGTDLSSIVKKKGPLSVDLAVGYIAQAARGFSYAHRQGIVHRDVKPANLLLDQTGTVKILDMGLARFELDQDTNVAAGLTATGVMMGTVDYVSPEQAFDPKLADARSDIYSLGCALYFLLTGQAPFQGDTLIKRILAHKDAPIPNLKDKLPGIPDWVQSIFERMVAKSPDERFQSMDQLVRAIENQAGTSGETSAGDEFARTLDHVSIQDVKSASSATLNKGAGSDSTASGRGGKATVTSPISAADFQKISSINLDSSQSSESKSQPQRDRIKPSNPAMIYGIAATAAAVILGGGLAFWIFSPGKARLVLEFSQSELSGATVTIDGKPTMTLPKGEGQYAFELRNDGKKHQVAVAKKGFANFEQSFDFSQAPEASITVKLASTSPPPSQIASNTKANAEQPPKKPEPAASGISGALDPELAGNDPNAGTPRVNPSSDTTGGLTIDPPNVNPNDPNPTNPPTDTPAKPAKTIVVGLGSDELPNMYEAFQRAQPGDTILIRHRGPLELDPVNLTGKTPLTIKGDTVGGVDYWPILRQSWHDPNQTNLRQTFRAWFDGDNLDLTFEKLHLGIAGPNRHRIDSAFVTTSGSLSFHHCTFTTSFSPAIDCFENDRLPFVRVTGSESSVFNLKLDNCVVRGGRLSQAVRCDGNAVAQIEANNVLWAGGFDSWFQAEGPGPHTLNLTNCTLLGLQSLAALPESALSSTGEASLKLTTKDCVFSGAYLNPSSLFTLKTGSQTAPEAEPFAKAIAWQATDVLLHQMLPKAKGPAKATAIKSLATAFNLSADTLFDADPAFRVRPSGAEMQEIEARDVRVNRRNLKNVSATIGAKLDELPPTIAAIQERPAETQLASKPRGLPRILQVDKKNGPCKSLEEAFAKLAEDDIIEITDSSTYVPKQNFSLNSKLAVLQADQVATFSMRAKEGAEPVIVLSDTEQTGSLPETDGNAPPPLFLLNLNCYSAKLDGLRFRGAIQRNTAHSFVRTAAFNFRVTNCTFTDRSAAPHAIVNAQDNGFFHVVPGGWPKLTPYPMFASIWVENSILMQTRLPSSMTINQPPSRSETAIMFYDGTLARHVTLRNCVIGMNMFSLISLSDSIEAFKFENCTIFGRPLFFLKGNTQRPVPTISFHENLIISPDNPLRFEIGGVVDQIVATGRNNALWLLDGKITPQTRNTDTLKLIPGPVMKLPPPYANGIDIPADDKDKETLPKQLKMKPNQDAGKMAPDGGPVGMRFDRLP